MSFDTYEESAHLGSRVELYLFEMANSAQRWAHTTSKMPITIGDITYTPMEISRTERDPDTGQFEIELPYDHPVVVLHVAYLPPSPVLVTITTYHRQDTGDVRRVQEGAIYGFQQKGVYGTLRCAEPGDPLSKLIPRASHGANCRHWTYGPGCTLDREDYKTIVDSIASVVGLEITAPEILAAGSGWFKFGYAENPANGEVRFITDHVGAVATLAYPFTGIDTSTVLHFFAGDDFTAETCRVKFNNKVNYLGFDFHPKYNVFREGYRPGGYTNTVGTGPGSGRLNPTGL
jgi:hypothetical protein